MKKTLCKFCPSSLKRGPRVAKREMCFPGKNEWLPICDICYRKRKTNILYQFRILKELL